MAFTKRSSTLSARAPAARVLPPPNRGDNFNFALFGAGQKNFFRGYVSEEDPSVLAPGVLVRGSQNVYKKLSGTIANRPGLALRGTADATLAGTKASTEWDTSFGARRVLRVCNGALQVESDIVASGTYVWYSLMTGLTLTRFVFDTWWNNSLKKDELLFVKGDTNLHMWDGGLALFVSATSTVITLDRDAKANGFNTGGGSVTIAGTTYTYSGITGSTLTGASDASAKAAGSVVLSAVVTTATTPASTFTNDFIRTIGNQVHVGSYTSQLVYVSQNSSYTNYSVPATRVPGDPDLLTLDSLCRGIAFTRDKKNNSSLAVISGGLGDWYEVARAPINVGAGASVVATEQVSVTVSHSSDLATALGHEFIDGIGSDIVFLDQNNQLRAYATVRNISNPVFPLLSLDVYTELKGVDFTGGHLRAVAGEEGETVYITAPLSGVDYLYEIRQSLDLAGNLRAERLWQPPQTRGLARIALIGAIAYGHSATNPVLYRLWNTGQWHDDAADGTSILSYLSRAVFSYLRAGERAAYTIFDKLYAEGYCTPGTTLLNDTLYEYEGALNVGTTYLNNPVQGGKQARLYVAATDPSLGGASLGDNPLGDAVTIANQADPNLPKFRAMRTLNTQDLFEYALAVYSANPDDRWELIALGVNHTPSEHKPVAIRS